MAIATVQYVLPYNLLWFEFLISAIFYETCLHHFAESEPLTSATLAWDHTYWSTHFLKSIQSQSNINTTVQKQVNVYIKFPIHRTPVNTLPSTLRGDVLPTPNNLIINISGNERMTRFIIQALCEHAHVILYIRFWMFGAIIKFPFETTLFFVWWDSEHTCRPNGALQRNIAYRMFNDTNDSMPRNFNKDPIGGGCLQVCIRSLYTNSRSNRPRKWLTGSRIARSSSKWNVS